MPYRILIALLVAWLPDIPLDKISQVNRLKEEAAISYQQGNYVVALVNYRYLFHSLQIKDDEIQINLAHCYYLSGDTVQARKFYQSSTGATRSVIRSIAWQQLGILAYRQNHFERSADYFKQALKDSPYNEGARYNYELLSKKLALLPAEDSVAVSSPPPPDSLSQSPPPPPPPGPGDSTKAPASRPTPTPAGSQNNQDSQRKQELEQMGLSQEQAENILEAMKTSEIQYIQQRRKSTKNRRRNKNEPDW
jgi:tetratricopeptide (TPR) repeat protein